MSCGSATLKRSGATADNDEADDEKDDRLTTETQFLFYVIYYFKYIYIYIFHCKWHEYTESMARKKSTLSVNCDKAYI